MEVVLIAETPRETLGVFQLSEGSGRRKAVRIEGSKSFRTWMDTVVNYFLRLYRQRLFLHRVKTYYQIRTRFSGDGGGSAS